jgi:hypothetical protein
MCGIVLFRIVIVMFVANEVVLVVDAYCTSVVSVVPICTSTRLWAPTLMCISPFLDYVRQQWA